MLRGNTMSIASKIKKAIEVNDWTIIHEIYEDLTGESAPEQSSKNKKTAKKRTVKKRVSNKKNNKQVAVEETKTGVGGRKSVLLTDNIPSEQYKTFEDEKQSNIERAKKSKTARGQRKREIYKVKCNECEGLFDSNIAENTIGQKCPRCLKQKIPSR